MYRELAIYRIISIDNLEIDLSLGLFAKNNAPKSSTRVIIGNEEIINERDSRTVPIHPGTVVNDYIPFYFSIRTPMLYNIVTGLNVTKRKQESIIYLCIKLVGIVNNPDYIWCFTDGNAAKRITSYYKDIKQLDLLDWTAIKSTDFRNNNSDGDIDRVRKKQSEFLIRDHVPGNQIDAIIVYTKNAKEKVESILKKLNRSIPVYIKSNFYFDGIY